MMPSTSVLSKPTAAPQIISSNRAYRHLSASDDLSYAPLAPPVAEEMKQFDGSDKADSFHEPAISGGEEDYENARDGGEGGGGEGNSGEDQADGAEEGQPPSKKSKRYHRHTVHQIQSLESFFKECAHPDEKQRQELSEALGLTVRQVKFWFQNRRTQMKAQQERSDNSHLRSENDRLRTENITIREAIKHASCPSCGPTLGGDAVLLNEQQLRVENLRLREQLEHVTMVATRYFGRPGPGQLLGRVPSFSGAMATSSSFGDGDPISNVANPSSYNDIGGSVGGAAAAAPPLPAPPPPSISELIIQDQGQQQQHLQKHGQQLQSSLIHSHPFPHPHAPLIQQDDPTLLDIALRQGGISEMEKAAVVDLAVGALQELLQVVQAQEPLWRIMPSSIMNNGDTDLQAMKQQPMQEELDSTQYFKQFPGGLGARPHGLSTEATRETGLVIMNSLALLDSLMDVSKWMEMFPSIISNALTVEVLSPGVGATLDGALQLMYAELQVLSPLVKTREMYFLRYCKQAAGKVWVVVDVSIDCLRDNPPPCLLQCRRRPSGCVIQDMPNGYSQVTWLEHVETNHRGINSMYLPLISSGAAFGAKRWLCTLQRYCENIASLLATNIPMSRDLGFLNSVEGRRCILRLAQRMVGRFVGNVSASSSSAWVAAGILNKESSGVKGGGGVSNNSSSSSLLEDVRVMVRDNPGDGVLLCAATSTWLPFQRHLVFSFLRNERCRAQWDVLANGTTQEMIHIAKGEHPGNSVSLLRVNGANPGQSNVLILQESCTDESGSLVVYMPVDFSTVTRVLQGEDPSDVLLLPSGFAILPDGHGHEQAAAAAGAATSSSPPTHHHHPSSSSAAAASPTPTTRSGSLLTISFQIAVSHVTSSRKLDLESVNTVSKIILTTNQHIRAALQCWDG